MPNFNAGAPGNPLDLMLGGQNLYGNAGRMLWRPQGGNTDPRTLTNGTVGNNVLWNDPRYFEQYVTPGSESGGGETQYRLRPQAETSFNRGGSRWTQLNNTTIGGPHGVIDPALAQYNQEFGLMTPESNILPDRAADNADMALYVAGSGLLGGATAAHAMAGGLAGGAPLEAGAGGAMDMGGSTGVFDSMGYPTYNVQAGLGAEAGAGATPGLLGEGAPGWAAEGGANVGGPQGLLDQAGGYMNQAGQWVMNNPIRAAGLLHTGYGLLRGSQGGNHSSQNASGSSQKASGGQGLPANAAPTQSPSWTPNPYLQAQIQRGYS